MINMDTTCVDPSLQLDVDVMTLDYLLNTAITRLLDEAQKPESQNLDQSHSLNAVYLVDEFVAIFNTHHPTPPQLPDVEFRIKLLQFVILFCGRGRVNLTTPSTRQLAKLRRENSIRALKWLEASHEDDQLRDLGTVRPGDGYIVTSPEEHVQLIDLLPLFFMLSALRADGTTSNKWMHLAGELMLQAVLEDRASPKRTPDTAAPVVAEAFAWGCEQGYNPDRQTDSVQDLFWDSERCRPSQEWHNVREQYFNEMCPVSAIDGDLQELRSGYPIKVFEAQMLEYLGALARSVELPILVQLEGESAFGLSKEETQQLRRRCGLLTEEIYEDTDHRNQST